MSTSPTVYTKGSGRFGNVFFRNLAGHFIAKNNDINVVYEQKELFDRLGIILFVKEPNNLLNKSNNYRPMQLTEDTFMNYMNKQNITHNLCMTNIYCQTREFSLLLKTYFNDKNIQQQMIDKNMYRDRYKQNDDVFLHIRLDDAVKFNAGEQYYDTMLSKLTFTNGYIASDTINHPMCTNLIKKYNLTIINQDIIDTIMFGSTCKYIVLSTGTFSYMIGLFGFYSEVYYPKIKKIWHGDIFVFDDWHEIDYD